MRDSPHHFSVHAVPCASDGSPGLRLDFHSLEHMYDAPGMLLVQIPADMGPPVSPAPVNCLLWTQCQLAAAFCCAPLQLRSCCAVSCEALGPTQAGQQA